MSAFLGVEQTAQFFGGGDATFDELEDDLVGRPDPVHAADDLPDRETGQLTVVGAGVTVFSVAGRLVSEMVSG